MASPWPVRVEKDAPTAEPLTLAQAKLRAALNWPDGDPRDDLMKEFIAAARAYVERRIARTIAAQAMRLYYDAAQIAVGTILQLPLPLVSVESVTSTDAAGVETALATTAYSVQRGPGLLTVIGPLPTDVRAAEGWRVNVTSGTDVTALDPELVQVIGLLTAHYATAGRDLVTLVAQGLEIPQGFEDALTPFLPQEIP
jgi:uncharacterized phiE125 gp8 family phage protein